MMTWRACRTLSSARAINSAARKQDAQYQRLKVRRLVHRLKGTMRLTTWGRPVNALSSKQALLFFMLVCADLVEGFEHRFLIPRLEDVAGS